MPAKLNDLVNRCKNGHFNLRYRDRSRPSREMDGLRCTGVRGTGWAYNQVDLINDKEYVDTKSKEFNSQNPVVVSNDPNNYAGHFKELAHEKLFIINKDKDIILEADIYNAEDGELDGLLEQLGYKGGEGESA